MLEQDNLLQDANCFNLIQKRIERVKKGNYSEAYKLRLLNFYKSLRFVFAQRLGIENEFQEKDN
jgi:hypothetical protein